MASGSALLLGTGGGIVDHVMNTAETHVSEEGRNLLSESAGKPMANQSGQG